MGNYLYNGIELPDINTVWDKTKYPYAVIFGTAQSAKFVVYSTKPTASVLYEGGATYYGTYKTGICDNFKFASGEDSTWVDDPSAASSKDPSSALYATYYRSTLRNVTWANHNVYDLDGTLYLAASEPVPVVSGTITGVEIYAPATQMAGDFDVVRVEVTGTGDFDDSVECSVSGNTHEDTKIDGNAFGVKNSFKLLISPFETAATIEIIATSVQDPNFSATATVQITQPTITGIDLQCNYDTIQQGDLTTFIAVVNAAAEDASCVPKWAWTAAIEGATDPTTIVSRSNPQGTLAGINVGLDEEVGNIITLTVTSMHDPSISVSKEFEILEGDFSGGGDSGDSSGGDTGGDDTTGPEITDISLTGIPDTVSPGDQITVGVAVSGTGSYSKAFTVGLSGHTSENTYFFKGGSAISLYIGSDETADTIVLTVTSSQDPSISVEEYIFIEQTGDGTGGDGTGTDTETEAAEKAVMVEALKAAFWSGFKTAAAMYCKE